MNIQVEEKEQYLIIDVFKSKINAEVCSEIEKIVAKTYSAKGKINFIIDLEKVNAIDPEFFVLLGKIQKICNNESGLLVLVSTNGEIIDKIGAEGIDFHLMLPTKEEGVDAVFMNELENEFKDEQEDEFEQDEDSIIN